MDDPNSSNHLIENIEMESCVLHLIHRLSGVKKSFVMLMFYYEMGIPDKKWLDSNANRYFPDFEAKHFSIKSQFDYYVDVFYYKIFSAWDSVGHLLNVLYDLKLDKVYFKPAVECEKLKSNNKNLSDCLKKIVNDRVYMKANKLRNDITHSYLPSSPGLRVDRNEKTENKVEYPIFSIGDSNNPSVVVGLSGCITSTDFVENIKGLLNLFVKTIECIKEDNKINLAKLII